VSVVIGTPTTGDGPQRAREQYRGEPVHVPASEAASPWIPFVPGVFQRHMAFDVRNNLTAGLLWVQNGGVVGRHRHRGRVSGYTLEGSWRYLEYDWVARPGGFVLESPGAMHTLVSDDPNGMKAMFWVQGALDFYDDDGVHIDTWDVFNAIDSYTAYCREHGLPVNQQLFL
jgi:quercetin dioxygenase-like cupin family protein